MKRTKVIGFFDSGFGGLSILKDVVKVLPQYSYIYLGDTARSPYGPRSREEVYEYTRQAVEYLISEGAHLIVLACNTASAEALRALQKNYLPHHHPQVRVLGVIVPTLEAVAEKKAVSRIGVLATEGTVRSKTFVKELHKINKKLHIYQYAAPLLVSLVEEGEDKTPAATLILKTYLKPLLAKRIDTLILGCTHYGHMEKRIKQIIGSRVSVISEGPIVAKKLKLYLERHPEIEESLRKTASVRFYTTDKGTRFKTLSSLFYGKNITTKIVDLAQ